MLYRDSRPQAEVASQNWAGVTVDTDEEEHDQIKLIGSISKLLFDLSRSFGSYSMEDPQCSGRPVATFMSLSMFPSMQRSLVGRGAPGPAESVSQQPQAPCRHPTVAWFPSFAGRSFSHGWSSIGRINPPFARGLGAGTGGSFLVSFAVSAFVTTITWMRLFLLSSYQQLHVCSIVEEVQHILVEFGLSKAKVKTCSELPCVMLLSALPTLVPVM